VNLLDLALVGLAVGAALGGFRAGAVARALGWAGALLGVVAGARLVPWVLDRLAAPATGTRALVAAGVLLVAGVAGQVVGAGVGARLRSALPPPVRLVDRVAGIGAGVLGLAALAWLVLPTAAGLTGAGGDLVGGSSIAGALERHGPDRPDDLRALRRLVGDRWFPEVFASLGAEPEVGPAPVTTDLPPAVVARATAATVLVEGRGCGGLRDGTGFAVEPGLVVTNAHVVAGIEVPDVIRPDGARRPARVVAFDGDRDLALLAVDGLDLPPLPLGDTEPGGRGAVFGHPGGGPLRLAPFRVEEVVRAVGRDIRDDHETTRRVLVLAAGLARGDSGAALVEADGDVVGVVFAVASGDAGQAYALDTSELRSVLDGPRRPVPTGACLAG
jgi:S1-C subfamily serine protease